MNEEHLAIYNQQFENCGECQYAEYLGCRNCETCAVEEYETQVTNIYKKAEKEEQELLEKIYGTEDKSDIYHKDDKCVYNKTSNAYKEALKVDEECKKEYYYPGIEDVMMNICYKCNRCGIWGK